MKTTYGFILAFITFVYFTGCDNKDHYVDLETGKTISVEKDVTTGYMVNAETKQPVGIYVNTQTHDTIYGRTGKVINNLVIRHTDGKFVYEEDGDYKVKEGDYKKKVEADGDVKIKDGDTKIKIEKDGEKKVKTE